MAHDVFISYSSRDKAVADAVCANLESRKVRCWIAPRDVPAGQTWAGALIEGIDASRVLVLVLSDGSNRSQQVIREVGEAVDKGIPILPLRIDDVQPSRDMGYYIKSIHWLDAITPPLEQHLGRLADQVQALLAAQGRPPVPPGPQETDGGGLPRPKPLRPAWQWAAAALGLLLILALAGFGVWSLAGGRGNRATTTLPALDGPTAVSTSPVAAARPTDTALPAPPTAGPLPAPNTLAAATATAAAVPTTPAPQPEALPAYRVAPGPDLPVEGHSVLWSPDGRYLVVGGMEVHLLDAEAGYKQIRSMGGYSDDNGLALSPDGRTLAVRRTGLKLYDLESGGELSTLFEESIVGGGTCGSRMDFSPDGATLAVIVGDTIKLFDVASGAEVNTLVSQGAVSLAYARDGKSLYVGGYYGAGVLDLATGEQLSSIGDNPGDASCVTLSPDGTLLASAGSWNGAVLLWDAASGRRLRTLAGHKDGVTHLAFSADGRILASAGNDIRIRVWDTATGDEMASLVGHTETPTVLAFSPDGATLASADRRSKVRLWTLLAGSEAPIPAPTQPATRAVPTRPVLSDRAISPANAAQVKLLRSTGSIGGYVAWSRDGQSIAVDAYDIAWIDAATLKEVRTFPVDGSFSDIAISPDGSILALYASGAKLFEIASGAELYTLYDTSISRGSICGSFVAFSPDGATLAVQEGDVVQLYDVAGGALVNTLVAKGAGAIAYSADGRSVYAGGTNGLDALDVVTGEATHLLGDAGSGLSCVSASPDGALLAVSGYSGTIILWDTSAGRQVRTWTASQERMTRMAFSPGGDVLATAGTDLKIRLWDAATGTELTALSGPTEDVSSLAFSPDGATLASAGRDWVVRFWGIQP